MGLENMQAALIDGRITTFVVFMQSPEGVSRMWFDVPVTNPEELAMAISGYGRDLQREVAKTQGTAPPQNRSSRFQ